MAIGDSVVSAPALSGDGRTQTIQTSHSATAALTADGGAKTAATGLKICCACPDTRRPRDDCIVANGAEHPQCVQLIEQHKECLRTLGFKV